MGTYEDLQEYEISLQLTMLIREKPTQGSHNYSNNNIMVPLIRYESNKIENMCITLVKDDSERNQKALCL